MKRLSKLFFPALLALACAFPVLAAVDDRAPAWLVAASKLPTPSFEIRDVPAVVLSKEESVQIASDGTVIRTIRGAVRILTRSGRGEAFAQAVTYGTDAAARCLYADWLVQQNNEADRKQAHTLYSDVLQDAKHGPRYARQHNRDWIDRAKTGLAEMAQR